MSDTPNTNQNEKAAKVRCKPERESVLTPTFAVARQTDANTQHLASPSGSSLLCACSL